LYVLLVTLKHKNKQTAVKILTTNLRQRKRQSQRNSVICRRFLLLLLLNSESYFRLLGERAFSHAGPATWNALPDHIRTVPDPVKFRKLLNHTILVKLLTSVDFVFFSVF